MMKNTDMKWTDVWVAPFYTDGMGYIYSSNDVTAFSVGMKCDPDSPKITKLVDDIITVLNGGEVKEKYTDLSTKYGCDLYWNGKEVGYFRGWGHLTGTGGLHLSESKATAIQDEMINYVMRQLCGFKEITKQELEEKAVPGYDKMVD